MKDRERKLLKMKEKSQKKEIAEKRQQEKRAAAFIPPVEDVPKKQPTASTSGVDVQKLKKKINKFKKNLRN